jgi:trehalose 6-phosphate phosphatase
VGGEDFDDVAEDGFFGTHGLWYIRRMGCRRKFVTELLSEEYVRIAHEIQAAPHFLLCLDFDGTLAPIVADPANAFIPDRTNEILASLADRPDVTLAIVSGRSVADLRSRVRLNIILAGNHGLEVAGSRLDLRHPQAAKWQRALHEMCGELLPRAVEIPGALVEDKGLTASVHYRNVAPDNVARVAELVRATVDPRAEHFRVRQGKKVLEILPRVHWNKGSAILWILERLRAEKGDASVCYVGDDATDEAAFRELPEAITIRVGYECPTAARFRVRNVREVCEFLKWVSGLEVGTGLKHSVQ